MWDEELAHSRAMLLPASCVAAVPLWGIRWEDPHFSGVSFKRSFDELKGSYWNWITSSFLWAMVA